jgi:hypothetical protein
MSKKPLGKPQKSPLGDPFTQVAGTENDQTCASTASQEEAVLTNPPIPATTVEMDPVARWHRGIMLFGGVADVRRPKPRR